MRRSTISGWRKTSLTGTASRCSSTSGCSLSAFACPAIIHYEPFDPALDRSILITTEIPGHPISDCNDAGVLRAVLRAAGRDLALINSIPVDGFGFMERSDPYPSSLFADFPDALAFVEADLERDLAALRLELPHPIAGEIRIAVRGWSSQLRAQAGRLAHGDFDGPHIYVDGTSYAGIIDFGEIRGADAVYDLGHFAMLTSDWFPEPALDPLLEGYREVTPLTAEDLRRMWLWAVLIGVRFLARTIGRAPAELRESVACRIAEALRAQSR